MFPLHHKPALEKIWHFTLYNLLAPVHAIYVYFGALSLSLSPGFFLAILSARTLHPAPCTLAVRCGEACDGNGHSGTCHSMGC